MRSTRVITFGYDWGHPPRAADHVFDVRDLDDPPKPEQIQERAADIVDRIAEGDTVAIGCDEGRRRSPAVAKALARIFGGIHIEHEEKE